MVVNDPLGPGASVKAVERSSWVGRSSIVSVVVAAGAADSAAEVVDTMFVRHDLVHCPDPGQLDRKAADNSPRTAPGKAPRLEGLGGMWCMTAGHKCNRLVTAGSYGCTCPPVVLHRGHPDIAVFVVIFGTQQQLERDRFGTLVCCTREHALTDEDPVACDGGVARAVAEVGLPRARLAGNSQGLVPANFVA